VCAGFPRYFVSREKVFDAARDFFSVRFEREMPGIEQMRFEIFQIVAVRGCAFGWKNEIVLAPDDQCRRLVLPEESLKVGIERHVGRSPLVSIPPFGRGF